MITVNLKDNITIDLEPGMEYEIDYDEYVGKKIFVIYDTRFKPEHKRKFLLENVVSYGDEM